MPKFFSSVVLGLALAVPLPTGASDDDSLERVSGSGGAFDKFWIGSPNVLPDTHLLAQAAWRDRIVHEARHLVQLQFVPYIWGGARLGGFNACMECRKCVRLRKAPDKAQLETCPVCHRCGIDCSHLANLLLQRVGLEAPYANTQVLASLSDRALARLYHFVNMGRDPSIADIGDLLLYPDHVVVVVGRRADGAVDILESRRGRNVPGGLGGIFVTEAFRPESYNGPLRKVLRHRRLFGLPAVAPNLEAFLLKNVPAT